MDDGKPTAVEQIGACVQLGMNVINGLPHCDKDFDKTKKLAQSLVEKAIEKLKEKLDDGIDEYDDDI